MSNVKAYYLNCKNRLEKRIVNDAFKDIDDVSYGELVEIIYELGRIQNGAYKPMVHCLLAYFSYAFTRQYITEKLSYHKAEDADKENTENNTDKGMTEKIAGGCVLDNWAKDLIPQISVESFNNQGMQESSGGQNPLADFVPKELGSILDVRLANVLTLPIERGILERAKNGEYTSLCCIMRQMEFLTLFFSDFSFAEAEKESPWKFAFVPGMTGAASLVFDNKRKDDVLSGRANFNVLNVIVNSMYGSEKLACVEEALTDAAVEYLVEYKEYKPAELREVKMTLSKTLERYSLKRDYEAWEKKFGGPTMPLPVWWFDFSYNILKRTRRVMQKKRPVVVTDIREAYRYTREVYKCISEQMTQQQNFYNSEDRKKAENRSQKEGQLKIAEQFDECPGIKILLEADDSFPGMAWAADRLFNGLKNSDI